MPHFYCLHCVQSIDAEETLVGARVACPSCAQVITVPGRIPHQMTTEARTFRAITLSFAEDEPPSPEKIRWGGAVWVTLAAFGFGFVNSLLQPNLHGMGGILGMAVGYALAVMLFGGIAALVVAGIRAALRKPFRPMLVRAYSVSVLVIIGLVMLGVLMGGNSTEIPARTLSVDAWSASRPGGSEAQRARETLTQLQANLKNVHELPVPSEAGGKVTPPQFGAEIQGNDVLDKLGRLMQEMMAEMATVKQTYVVEVQRADIGRLLSAKRVAEDTGFVESRAMLAAFRKAMKEYQSGVEKVLADFPQKLESAGFDPVQKANALRNYEKGMIKVQPVLQENLELEVQTVELMGTIIDLLESTRADWQVDGERFYFHNPKDLERYNAYMAVVAQNTRRQDEIQKNFQIQSHDNLEKIKALLPE